MQQRLCLLKILAELLQEILWMKELVHLRLSESQWVITQIQVHDVAGIFVETLSQSMHMLCRKTPPWKVKSAHELLGIDDLAELLHQSTAIQIRVWQFEVLKALTLANYGVEEFLKRQF